MNKKGLIATSLLYSFFLLFCALILIFIGNIGHKSILLNKEIDQINTDLHTVRKLEDVNIGSYFRLNVCINSNYINQSDTLDYIIFDNGKNNSNKKASLISKNYSFKLNSLELVNNIISTISVKQGSTDIPARSMTISDYEDKISAITDARAKNLLIYSDFSQGSMYFLASNNPRYAGSKVINVPSINPIDLDPAYIKNEKVFVRLVFDIDNETMIIGGEGTSSNPYILRGGAAEC